MSSPATSRTGFPSPNQRSLNLLYDGPVYLNRGQEWHSNPFMLSAGDDLTLTCRSDFRFYAGVFDKTTHDRLVSPQAGRGRRPFPFRFGTDQVSFDYTRRITVSTEYVVVVRRGIYTPGGPIQIRITRTLGEHSGSSG